MKSSIALFIVLLTTCASLGQGTLLFRNGSYGEQGSSQFGFVTDSAAISSIDSSWSAQLLLALPGGEFTPISPLTKFQDGNAAARGFFDPVILTVPGRNPGERVTLYVQVFHEECVTTVTGPFDGYLGDSLAPGSIIFGSPRIFVDSGCVPECSPYALLLLAANVWAIVRWRFHSSMT